MAFWSHEMGVATICLAFLCQWAADPGPISLPVCYLFTISTLAPCPVRVLYRFACLGDYVVTPLVRPILFVWASHQRQREKRTHHFISLLRLLDRGSKYMRGGGHSTSRWVHNNKVEVLVLTGISQRKRRKKERKREGRKIVRVWRQCYFVHNACGMDSGAAMG
ncbi:hypothetical protein BJV78DRAFT_730084 [Lactifluus subvellereus]|nr:hypothetical protein BJV78DRAFT_730084 [Lactifluus subvellereus]